MRSGDTRHLFAHTVVIAILLALVVSYLAPLPSLAADTPGSPLAAGSGKRAGQGTSGSATGCLTVKESVVAGAAAVYPAEGWTVSLSGPEAAEAQTDANGEARFTGLATGSYAVSVEVAYGFSALTPTTVQVEVKPSLNGDACATAAFSSEPAPTSCIDGTLVDEAGSPLSGWTIYAEPTDGNGPTFLTLSGEDGTFHFPSLTVGTWTVREDVLAGWSPVSPAELRVAVTQAAGEQCIQVAFNNRPAGLCIEGSLMDAIANVGVAGAPVTATLQSDGAISTTQTDAAGHFRFDELAPGTYEVRVGAAPGWAAVGPLFATVSPTAGAGCSELKFWVRTVVAAPPATPTAPPPTPTVSPAVATAPPATPTVPPAVVAAPPATPMVLPPTLAVPPAVATAPPATAVPPAIAPRPPAITPRPPVARPHVKTSACRAWHTVVRGDTIGDLAYLYHVSGSALLRANKIHNPDKIYIGQVLCIP